MRSKIEYFADFILCPIYIWIMLYYANMDIIDSLILLMAGVFLWTLLEYYMHRYLFHESPLFRDDHELHHRFPKNMMGNKPWQTATGVGICLIFFFLLGGKDISLGLTSGLLLGYLGYGVIHVWLHQGNHRKFKGPMAHLYKHHARHHRGGAVNFGVTTTLWDYVFRTKI